jgi:hypothetical protein
MKGMTGPTGPAGIPGILTIYTVADTVVVPPATLGTLTMTCAPGDFVTGGGFEMFGPTQGILVANIPANSSSWLVEANNTATTPFDLDGYAICADLTP